MKEDSIHITPTVSFYIIQVIFQLVEDHKKFVLRRRAVVVPIASVWPTVVSD